MFSEFGSLASTINLVFNFMQLVLLLWLCVWLINRDKAEQRAERMKDNRQGFKDLEDM